MNKILITGGCGYVGSVLVPKLLKLKYKVIVLDTQWFGINLKKNKNLTIIKKDVRDISSKDLNGVEIVYHLASIANDPMGALDPELTWEISCLGTMKLLEASLKNKVKKIIYASSSSVYGIKKEKKVVENLSLEPISNFSMSIISPVSIPSSIKCKVPPALSSPFNIE